MVNNKNSQGEVDFKRKSLNTIQKLKKRLENYRHEPIAIVGTGCRFPGNCNDLVSFWKLIKENKDTIQEIPPERWSWSELYHEDGSLPGKMNTKWGSFLEDYDQFDASFFKIFPKEAIQNGSTTANFDGDNLERAREFWPNWSNINGSNTGVFIGVYSSDYMLNSDYESINNYTSSGVLHSIVANRLSYFFDFHGPSMAIDTACSSSLVAIHTACQSLRNRECQMAVAGGVHLNLSPFLGLSFSKFGMMASDGRCKTFDSRADGFVRGEGCGVVVLKRLSDALVNEDPIQALIRGSAVNQDGLTNGLTAPNGLSQQEVIRQALKVAKIKPQDISYVEAHGTGTSLGILSKLSLLRK